MPAAQLTIVGWYHSHPTFATEPSVRDVDNHGALQALFQCEQTRLFPYIGVIMGAAAQTHKDGESGRSLGLTLLVPGRPLRPPAAWHGVVGAVLCCAAAAAADGPGVQRGA
jgi:hypothetical protein